MTKVRSSIVVGGLLVGACLLVSGAYASSATPRHREGEVIVRFKTGLARADMGVLAARGHAAATVARTLAAVGRPHTTLVRFPKSIPVETMVARYKALPGVTSAEPNYVWQTIPPPTAAMRGSPWAQGSAPRGTQAALVQAAAAGGSLPGGPLPNDPDVSLNFMVYQMDLLAVWPDKTPCPTVAVIGTGADAAHPDLIGHVIKGNDWVNDDKDPDDDNGWGTHEAGIVAAGINNGKGVTGFSNGKVLAIKVMDSQGFWTAFDAAGGILDAAANPAVKIIYFSGWEDSDITVIRDAVQTAVTAGKLLVFPAGDSVTTPQYPAFYSDASFPTLSPSVISVTASGLPGPQSLNYGCMPTWANSGSWISAFAPGAGAYSTTPTHPFWLNTQFGVPFGYADLDSGSEAAVAVAATAARAWAVMPAGTTAIQVKDRVVSTGWMPVANPKTVMIDTNGDGIPDTPCQPSTMNDAALQPDVAAAMGRHQIFGRAFDAQTRSPLSKGSVTAFLNGKAVGFGSAISGGAFNILDLPEDTVHPYDLRVNVPGYTAGPLSFASPQSSDCGGGSNTHNCTFLFPGGIGLPKNIAGRYHIVTNWAFNTLETHVFTPTAGPIQCDVGVSHPLSSLSCFLGSLTTAPFVRELYHGGSDPHIAFDTGNDHFSIKAPLYPTSPGTPYEIFLTDLGALTLHSPNATVITRVWKNGKIIGSVMASQGDTTTNNCTYSGGGTVCDTFYVGDLSQAGVFTAKGIYGTSSAAGPPGVIPYSAFQPLMKPH